MNMAKMINIKYKTRGNNSPKGKPRVYFCCHPKDFEKHFETISNEILTKQNCAIWYVDEDFVRNEDFFADLKQMQLFVMPVTTNLLCTENEAIDIEFKFAIENHIPVLPLMQESGLEELFNKKCGDLQFLDKNNTDITVISYDEKLQKYLESVLISDELADKIRAAFDAYVFLSYRKKDRKYAQKLMRLIHKNEFCRDIAIWYDEFLTPGENFNDSIKEALQKSDLFVLAVTPNLVNEPNYIMTTEYPMAKREGKPILPAELIPTDRKQLSEKYEDIPNPTDAYNEAVLSEVILESIRKIAIMENDNSPEHNFFIGLAYLGGIDVEVDNEKALSLITSAADNGLLEAMKKLVDIFEYGKGADINIHNAINWQKLVVISYNDHDNCYTSKEDHFGFAKELWRLGDLYKRVGDYSSATKTFRQMQNICEESFNIYHDASTARYLSVSYTLVGEMLEKNGNYIEAIEIYLKAKEVFELLVEVSFNAADGFALKDENIEYLVASLYDLSVIQERITRYYMELEDYTEAEQVLNSRVNLLERITSIIQNELLLCQLATAYNDFSLLCFDTGKSAEEYLLKAYTLGKEIAQSCREKSNYEDVGLYSGNLVTIAIMDGDISQAKQYFYDFYEYVLSIHDVDIKVCVITEYVKKLNERFNTIFGLNNNRDTIIESNVTYPEAIVLFKDFITIFHNIGIQLYENSQKNEAVKVWNEGISIVNVHKLTSETAILFLAASFCYEKLAMFFSDNGNQPQTFEYVETTDMLLKEILSVDKSIKITVDICRCYRNLIDALKNTKCPKFNLIPYYRQIVLLYKNLCSTVEVDEHTAFCANYYEGLSNIYWEQNSMEDFCSCAVDTIKYMKLIYIDRPKTRWKSRYFALCKKAYESLITQEKETQALDVLLNWYDTCKRVFDNAQTLEELIDVSYRIDAIVKHYKRFEDYEKAIEYLLIGKDVDEHIVQISSTANAYRDLSFRYENLGYAYMKTNDPLNARFYFEKTVANATIAVDMEASSKSYAALMFGYDDLSLVSEKDEKILLLKKCLDLVEILISMEENEEKFVKYKDGVKNELSSLIGE